MASIGSLSVTLGLSSASFLGGLSRAQGALSNFAGQAKATLSGMSVTATGWAGGLLAAGGAMSSLVTSAVQAAADMESLELSFQGIAGGAEQAKQLVKDIAAFAAETPFETMPLADSVKLLSTMGFEARESLEIIKRLGDVIAASGQGAEGLNRVALALGQIRLMGRLQGQDAMQLTNAGIPIWDALAKRLGKTTAEVRKQSEAGGIDARTAILAVLDVANDPKFKGSQERLSKSLNGLWSTLKDNTTLALADLGKIIADSFDLRGTAISITSFIGVVRANLSALQAPLRAVGALFLAMRDTALEGFTRLVSFAGELTQRFKLDKLDFSGLRASMVDFLQWIANKLQDLGGLFLKYVLAPMSYGLARITDGIGAMIAGLARTPLFKNAEMEQIGISVRNISDEFLVWQSTLTKIGNQLLTNHSAIDSWFSSVRGTTLSKVSQRAAQWLGAGLGYAQSLGLLPSKGTGELALSGLTAQGMAKEIKFAGAAERGSQEAYSNAVRDMAQRTGGKGSIADKLDANNKKTDDTNKLLEKMKDAIAANWLGVATGIL